MKERKSKALIDIGYSIIALIILVGALEECRAFVPLVARQGGASEANSLVHNYRHGRGPGCSPLRSSASDAVDAMPSEVMADTNGGDDQLEFGLAMELIQMIDASIGEGYIPLSKEDKRSVLDLIIELESSGVDTGVQFPRDLDKLDGRWRLMFTNNLLGLGKLSPVRLKDVYQVVDSASGTLTNVAYAYVSPPLFAETWGRLGDQVGQLARVVEDTVSFPVDFNIKHSFEVTSKSSPAQVQLVQKEFNFLNVEDPDRRSLVLPALQPLAAAGAGRFDTTFLGDQVRVSRGRFGEVRVFLKEA